MSLSAPYQMAGDSRAAMCIIHMALRGRADKEDYPGSTLQGRAVESECCLKIWLIKQLPREMTTAMDEKGCALCAQE